MTAFHQHGQQKLGFVYLNMAWSFSSPELGKIITFLLECFGRLALSL
jgi:hypothetical protein